MNIDGFINKNKLSVLNDCDGLAQTEK